MSNLDKSSPYTGSEFLAIVNHLREHKNPEDFPLFSEQVPDMVALCLNPPSDFDENVSYYATMLDKLNDNPRESDAVNRDIGFKMADAYIAPNLNHKQRKSYDAAKRD